MLITVNSGFNKLFMNGGFYHDCILSPLEKWAYLGDIKNCMGTRLIGYVPHIARNAYVNVIYAPLNEDELLEFSDRLERPNPVQYNEFLRHANGLMICSGAIRVMGYVPI